MAPDMQEIMAIIYIRLYIVLLPLAVPQMEDRESIVAVMVECLGVRFWEEKGSVSPQVENEAIASCNYKWIWLS